MEPSADEQGTDSSVYQNAGAKLVRRAEFSIQTEQFDQTAQALDRLVSECGGYFETAAVRGGSYRDASASRWGEPGEDIFQILPILFGEKICYNNSGHDFILRMQEAIWIDWNSCCVI